MHQYRRSLRLRLFRQLSRDYSASEKSWEFVIEALLFAIVVVISAFADLRGCGRAAPVSVRRTTGAGYPRVEQK
jgi:hypothetical protein